MNNVLKSGEWCDKMGKNLFEGVDTMKKLLSVAVALVLLTAVFAGFGTASAANYVGEFSSSVSSLFNTMLYGQGLYDEPLGEIGIRPSTVLE